MDADVLDSISDCYASRVTCSDAAESETHIASYGRGSGAALAQTDKSKHHKYLLQPKRPNVKTRQLCHTDRVQSTTLPSRWRPSSTSTNRHQIPLTEHTYKRLQCSSSSHGLNLGFLRGKEFNHAIDLANELPGTTATGSWLLEGVACERTGDACKLPGTSLKLGSFSRLV